MRMATMTFTGAALLGYTLDSTPAFAADPPQTPGSPSMDPLAAEANAALGFYVRSLEAFEAISSSVLEEFVDEGERKSISQIGYAWYVVEEPLGLGHCRVVLGILERLHRQPPAFSVRANVASASLRKMRRRTCGLAVIA
jgi:hypothetical protein